MNRLTDQLKQITGAHPQSIHPLAGGAVGEVYRVVWQNGEQSVAKFDSRPQPQLAIEGAMLRYLAKHSELPVPHVTLLSERGDLLLMDLLPGESRFTPEAQRHAAELLATLHSVTAPAYGFAQDTLIGLYPQPNPWTDSWIEFFRTHRVLHLGKLGVELGRMETKLLHRIERACTHLEEWLEEPEQPTLVHGDVWTTNVLAVGERITGFLDPALYYGHHEMDLAYILWTDTFGEPFFERYHEVNPIHSDFFELRQQVYTLYPLLSHVCHFGGKYVEEVEGVLSWLGY